MRHAKMHKYEVGKSRPTENKAINGIVNDALNEQVNEWIAKIDACQELEGIESQVKAVADVIVELAEKIKVGEVDEKVIEHVLRRRNVKASLLLAFNKLRTLPIFQE